MFVLFITRSLAGLVFELFLFPQLSLYGLISMLSDGFVKLES